MQKKSSFFTAVYNREIELSQHMVLKGGYILPGSCVFIHTDYFRKWDLKFGCNNRRNNRRFSFLVKSSNCKLDFNSVLAIRNLDFKNCKINKRTTLLTVFSWIKPSSSQLWNTNTVTSSNQCICFTSLFYCVCKIKYSLSIVFAVNRYSIYHIPMFCVD